MQSLHVNGYDMPYLDVGEDRSRPPLVCVHGSLNDFRVWGCVLGPLTQRHRVIACQLAALLPGRMGWRRRHLFDRPACPRRHRLHREARRRPGRSDGPFPRRAHLLPRGTGAPRSAPAADPGRTRRRARCEPRSRLCRRPLAAAGAVHGLGREDRGRRCRRRPRRLRRHAGGRRHLAAAAGDGEAESARQRLSP